MRIVHKIGLLITVLAFLQGCRQDQKVQDESEVSVKSMTSINSSNNNLNISVLIDLSDRIDPNKYPSPAMEFYLRDIGYLESVAHSFEGHLLNKKVIQIDDKMQVFIDPEPSDQSLNKKIEELKIHFTRHNVSRDSILLVSKKYGDISRLIYESAIEDSNYVGSDIWGFFKNKVDDYCMDEGYRNILVILTDGYMFHEDASVREENRSSFLLPRELKAKGLNKSKWQNRMEEKDFGFIVANNDLSNLEVLVLGINPAKSNPYEEDVIRAYWSKWFDEMGVKNYEIKQADLPTHVDKVIQDFILKHK